MLINPIHIRVANIADTVGGIVIIIAVSVVVAVVIVVFIDSNHIHDVLVRT